MPIKTRLRLAAAAATIAAALCAPQPALAAGCANANANPNDINLTKAKRATLCLLNRQRHAHGIRKLRENRRLDRASQRHANDMSFNNYFAHGDFVGRIQSAHYLRGARGYTVGENIAWGSWDYATPAKIVHGWMHSPGHRANILNGRFHEIGLGIARGAPVGGQAHAGTYVTDFGTRF
ncbi:MAG: hypothetical protein QOH76_619 [Thermoleophilaceae bacterium]|jgi:uncharacterized protein YkwD|nr:hypothetical protein [Thermoleophilaceae bacterium]